MTSQDVGKEENKIYAHINYEDPYVQPLILSALSNRLPPNTYQLINNPTHLPTPRHPYLQILQYESLDFDALLAYPQTTLSNAYVIRKALIRKHFLSTTLSNWIVKYPDSVLKKHVKPSVELELDYAEFLDEALVEAWDLKESWERNEGKERAEDREWWILKPGMSEKGQGIRLFSSEEELAGIFEGWDSESEDDEDDESGDARSDEDAEQLESKQDQGSGGRGGIITSQLRHFVAQPYIHPPLLLTPPPSPWSKETPAPSLSSESSLRKFHIRTYVVAVGALKVYVYKPMLALFAARPYIPPWDASLRDDVEEVMKAHLTNTCLQDSNEREGSVGLFWELPDELPDQAHQQQQRRQPNWKTSIFEQICAVTGEVFEAAARGMSIYFQPLPNAFDVFGLDFMVSVEGGELRAWLLEVNAFPDFGQTGSELRSLVGGLWEGVMDVGVKPFFGIGGEAEAEGNREAREMAKVLDIDLGRR